MLNKKETFKRLEQAGHLNGVVPAGHGHGAIFIGDISALTNSQDHIRFGIVAAVSCLAPSEMPVVPSTIRKQFLVPLEDQEEARIYEFFEPAYEFIQEASRAGNVLIHCRFGISRSATMTIAYLMRRLGWALSRAYAYLKEVREVVCPNFSFCNQLISYQKELYVSQDWQIRKGQLVYLPAQKVKVSQASTVDSRESPEPPKQMAGKKRRQLLSPMRHSHA